MVKTRDKTSIPSTFTINYNRFIRYIKVGAFLHMIAVLGLLLFLKSFQTIMLYEELHFDMNFCVWLLLGWTGFVLPFFSEMDAYGRYQNYKMIKDKLYVNGFDTRLVKPFMYSNCQRISILIAATDLDYSTFVKSYFYEQGYRWYHLLPQSMTKNPFIVFSTKFWEKILFTRYYKLQNFYW